MERENCILKPNKQLCTAHPDRESYSESQIYSFNCTCPECLQRFIMLNKMLKIQKIFPQNLAHAFFVLFRTPECVTYRFQNGFIKENIRG